MEKINEFLDHLEIPFDALPDADRFEQMTKLFDQIYGYQFSIHRKDKRKKKITFVVTLAKKTYEVETIQAYQLLFQKELSFDTIETKEELEELCWKYVRLKLKCMKGESKRLLIELFPGLEEFYFLFRALQKTPYKKDPFQSFDFNNITFHSINEYLFSLVSSSQQNKIELEEQRLEMLKQQREEYQKEQEEQRMRERILAVESIYFEGKNEIVELELQQDYNQVKLEGLMLDEKEQQELKSFLEASIYELSMRNFFIRIWKYWARKKWEAMIAHATIELERMRENMDTIRKENQNLEHEIQEKITALEKEIEVCKYHEFEDKLSHYKELKPNDVSKELEQVNQMIASSKLNQLLHDLKVLYERNEQYLNLAPAEFQEEKGYQLKLEEKA